MVTTVTTNLSFMALCSELLFQGAQKESLVKCLTRLIAVTLGFRVTVVTGGVGFCSLFGLSFIGKLERLVC